MLPRRQARCRVRSRSDPETFKDSKFTQRLRMTTLKHHYARNERSTSGSWDTFKGARRGVHMTGDSEVLYSVMAESPAFYIIMPLYLLLSHPRATIGKNDS